MTDSRLISFGFVAVFLSVQGLGLHIGQIYFNAIQAGVVEPIVSNPESVATSLYLISYILVATVVIMLIIKFKRNLLRALEIFVLFMSSWITFGFLIPVSILYIDVGMILAIALIIWKLKRPGFASQTTSVIFSLSGIGSILGASLGVIPSLVFLLAVSIYDFISVFLTKHMVFMANAIVKEPTIFTVSMPADFKAVSKLSKKSKAGKTEVIRMFNLGSGDIALPLVFLVSVMSNIGLKNAIFSLVGVTVALFILLNWRIKDTLTKPRAMPAMPYLALGLFAGFVLSLFV